MFDIRILGATLYIHFGIVIENNIKVEHKYMRPFSRLVSYLIVLILIVGCKKESAGPADLVLSDIHFTQTFSRVFLDLPDGTYQPDNPNFHPNNPETWTGNMAKYVKHYYSYSVSYRVKNIGLGVAYITEIDLFCSYNDGEEKVVTIALGDIQPNGNVGSSASITSINKQLKECSGEVFWNDY